MALIGELIDAGLQLKRQGNLSGAIEHFRQLQATYPKEARIMAELAHCWRAVGLPAQALLLYKALLELPTKQQLPRRELPRLYAEYAATLQELGEYAESLTLLQRGLQLFPQSRSLRAWRIFALQSSGAQDAALVDALELMLEVLAPSRWDGFQDEIAAQVALLRAQVPATVPPEGSGTPAVPAAQQETAPAPLHSRAQDEDIRGAAPHERSIGRGLQIPLDEE